jgi:hypothetical protein
MKTHLIQLAERGIGSRAVQAASDVARTVIVDVMAGRKLQVRAETVRRVLAVDEGARADSSYVDAWPTHDAIRELLRLGLRRYEIAARLGNKAKQPSLQILKSPRVLASTALRVKKLLADVHEELRLEREAGNVCAQCGYSHEVAARLRTLKAHMDVETAELRKLRPFDCIYGPTDTGYRRMRRDLTTLRREQEST